MPGPFPPAMLRLEEKASFQVIGGKSSLSVPAHTDAAHTEQKETAGTLGSIVVAFVGAVILVGILPVISPGRRRVF